MSDPTDVADTGVHFPIAFPFALPPQACRGCGCTDERACAGGCWWVEPDLCSQCVEALAGCPFCGALDCLAQHPDGTLCGATHQPLPPDVAAGQLWSQS